jgi:hypothetical protein
MGMVKKLLRPGVQDGQHPDGAANEAWIAGDVDNRLGRGLHQQGITVTVVGSRRRGLPNPTRSRASQRLAALKPQG